METKSKSNVTSDLDLKGSAAGPVCTNLFSLINKKKDLIAFLGLVPVAVWSLERVLSSQNQCLRDYLAFVHGNSTENTGAGRVVLMFSAFLCRS